MGHFLNKTLKDIANRYKLSRGYRVEFYPGWDCHGLPIELKAIEATLGKSKPKKDSKEKDTKKQEELDQAENDEKNQQNAKINSTEPIPLDEIPESYKCRITGQVLWGMNTPIHYHPQRKQLQLRDLASKFAQSAIMRQKKNMQDWSLLGDFQNPYITMDPTFEASETLVLGNLIEKNSLYRQLMPVYWSPSSKTALAESELEYQDITSTAVYVCMPIVQHGGVFKTQPKPLLNNNNGGSDNIQINPEALSLLIWTTTPWTLPANRAICVAPEGQYSHVKVSTTMSVVWKGHVYDIVQDKNIVMIQSQIDALAKNWSSLGGFNFDSFKQFLPQDVDADTGTNPTQIPLPPGTKLIKRAQYDPEVHGSKAVITKGKDKGQIADMFLERKISHEIVQADVNGTDLAQCQYISPLSINLKSYLMTDAESCIDFDLDSGEISSLRPKVDADGTQTKPRKFTLPTHKVIPADHVLVDQGSGCVHTAPAHGEEDFLVGQQNNLPVACPVDEKGEYTSDVGPELCGVSALEGGSKMVCKFLQNNGALLHREEYEHRYPHDWRTLKPVMLRATSQWFCKLDQAKETAKNALQDVFVTTDQARSRLTSFIDSRDRWCISRQRYWGLPLPVFYKGDQQEDVLCGKEITLHLSKIYAVLGTQAWWTLPSWRLLPPSQRGKINKRYQGIALDDIVSEYLKNNGIQENRIATSDVTMATNRHDYTSLETLNGEETVLDPVTGNKVPKTKKIVTHIDDEPIIGLPNDFYDCDWKIGEDTVDVWLDSGSSWFSALYNKLSQSHLDGKYFENKGDMSSPQDEASGDDQVNNLFGSLKRKQTQNEQQQENFDPYKAIFGDLQKIRPKNYDELIGQNKPDNNVDELSWQADLYLEGTDQHRGWFQSSLLLSSLLTGYSPFKALHSHGFVVDDNGRKMSKSLGNGVEPDSIILDQGHGVDVLRCWAASVDCSRDATMGKNTIQTTIDFVRKWRGVMRFALGSLSTHQRLIPKAQFALEQEKAAQEKTEKAAGGAKKVAKSEPTQAELQEQIDQEWDFDPNTDLVPYNELHILDQYVLHHLQLTLKECEQGYQHYQLHKVINSIRQFMQGPLSSVYFDLSKDRLYANQSNHKDKKTALTTLYFVFSSLLKVMTPVLPHLSQEIFSFIPSRIQKGLIRGLNQPREGEGEIDFSQISTDIVMNSGWVEIKPEWENGQVVQHFDYISGLRGSVNQCIEVFRQQTNLIKEQEKKAAEKAQKATAAAAAVAAATVTDEAASGGKNNKNQNGEGKKGGKKNAKKDNETQEEALPQPTLQINGDVASLPKVGSSNEVDVVITIHAPNGAENSSKFAQLLSSLNTDQFHELFMVSSTVVQIDTNPIQQSTQTQASNTNVFNIRSQFDAHSPSSQRQLLETTTSVKMEDTDEVLNITIGVAKSTGSKCPRCWRFSSPHDSISQSIETTKNTIEKGSVQLVYKSFIPTSQHFLQKNMQELNDNHHLAAHDDILCQRCDDFFTQELGGDKLHL
jgi:isoleucyl-tRNA synthetase